MIEKLKSMLGLARTDTKAVAVREIAAGLTYDLSRFGLWANWMEKYWNGNPVIRQPQFEGHHLFEEMDGDGHIFNSMNLAKDAVLSKPFYVRSARPGDALEDRKAALAAWQFDRIKQLEQKKRGILTNLDHGYSITEMIWQFEDVTISGRKVKKAGVESTIRAMTMPGALIISDLKTRIPTAFSFDGLGNLFMLPGNADGSPINYGMPRKLTAEEVAHFMVATHDPRFGSRYGWPLKASMFWPWLMKKAIKIYRMIFVEKYGMPFLEGTYPPGATAAEMTSFEEKLKGLQKNSYLMKPEGFALEFVDAINKTGTMDVFQNALDYCDGDISEVALGHRAATSENKDQAASAMRQDKLEMLGLELDSVFNDQLIPLLIDANFEPNGLYPYVVTQTRPEADVDKEVFRLVSLHNIGLPLSKAQIYEITGLLKPLEGEDDELPGAKETKAPDTVGGDNLPNTNISDKTMKTLGQQPDAATQGGRQGNNGANRNIN